MNNNLTELKCNALWMSVADKMTVVEYDGIYRMGMRAL